ncbi:flagellar basal-body MS-ring/collar protein FliF, partial [Glaciimonas sp. CA11.2]
GNLLSVPSAGNRGLDASQLKFSQEIEQSYIRRIEAILQPIVGSGNVKAQVVADIDFATVENTDEKYRPNQDPEKAAIRSQQSSDSNQQGATPAGGVPGALSNQPPLNPTAPIVTAAANRPLPGATAAAGGQSTTQASANPIGAANRPASTGGSSNVRRDVTTNYEVDRSIRHVQQSAGGIKRLSVAVVVNYRGIRNAQGKIAAQAIPPAELEQVRNLVREAMGFNTERGDSLNVVNSQFVSSEIVEPVLPWWQQPENIALGKTLGQYLLIAVLGLWLWFGVLRPLLRKYLAPPLEVPQALPINAEPAEDIPAETVSLSAEAQVRANMRHQENLTHAKALSEKDPKLVAMVIKNWMDSGKNANG